MIQAMTTRRLKRIAPLQAGKMLGALYGCIALLAVPFFLVFGLFGAFATSAADSQHGTATGALAGGVMIFLGLMIPVFYGLCGFVFGIITAVVYNLIAGWIGGIEVEVE